MINIKILSKTPRAKWEVLKNEKCTWGSRGCICSNGCHKNHLLNVSLKRKTDNISIIIRRMTTEKRARAVGTPRQDAGKRQESHFFREYLQIPVSYRQMSQFTTNQIELIIFKSPVISDTGIQRTGAYAEGQRYRYVLL